MDLKKLFKKKDKPKKEKDKSIMDYFSGSNPNRKKVQKIIEERQEKEKKEDSYECGGVKYSKLKDMIKGKKKK